MHISLEKKSRLAKRFGVGESSAEVDQIARDGDAREQAEKLPQTPPNANSAAAASAATPNAVADGGHSLAQLCLLRNLQCQTMPSALYHPQPMALQQPLHAPMQQTPAAEDDLVETSGRAMMIRLRQLHAKDPKLFLQAQNAIGNAIFNYEMEADKQ